MPAKWVQVPATLLVTKDLTTAAKFIWVNLAVLSRRVPRKELAECAGLSQPTVREGLAQLAAKGWYDARTGLARHAVPDSARVRIPVHLLAEPFVGVRGKLLYGWLQLTPAYQRQAGQTDYESLAAMTDADSRSVRTAIADLCQSGWMTISQQNKFAAIHFSLIVQEEITTNPVVGLVLRFLKRSDHGGEQLMRGETSCSFIGRTSSLDTGGG